MALSDGENFVLGDILSFQQANRVKNHFRGASAPASIVNGMIFSDSDDDKLYHSVSVSGSPLEEILQETLSYDKSPIFDNLFLDDDSGALSDPPEEDELIAIFGASPGNGFQGWAKNSGSGGKLYLIHFYGGTFYYAEMTAAV